MLHRALLSIVACSAMGLMGCTARVGKPRLTPESPTDAIRYGTHSAVRLRSLPMGPDWSIGESKSDDAGVVLSVHEVDIRNSYTSIVFSVAESIPSDYEGGLVLDENSTLVDSSSNQYGLHVYQTWLVYSGVTIGSISFAPISSTVASVSLEVPAVRREDDEVVGGPISIELLVDDLRRVKQGETYDIETDLMSEDQADYPGGITVRWNGDGFDDYDYFGATEVPPVESSDVTPGANPTDTPDVASTAEPQTDPTLEWAPNASTQFTLRVTGGSPSPLYIHAALEPSTGTYWYETQ